MLSPLSLTVLHQDQNLGGRRLLRCGFRKENESLCRTIFVAMTKYRLGFCFFKDDFNAKIVYVVGSINWIFEEQSQKPIEFEPAIEICKLYQFEEWRKIRKFEIVYESNSLW